jgi:hypothetical protein
VRACESAQSEHYGRHARLFATYDGTTGHAVDVHFNGNYFDDKPIGPCILAAVRDVPAPRFQRPRWDTDYEFLLH